jgi:hypothetical protein
MVSFSSRIEMLSHETSKPAEPLSRTHANIDVQPGLKRLLKNWTISSTQPLYAH